jgi:deoxycytidine triphosphate deaminase
MYLSDVSIKKLLPQIQFETDRPNDTFNFTEQVQPCSVDLRLDYMFWKQRKGKTIDFRKDRLMEISPRQHWEKIILHQREVIKLKPGQMLLGRTLECFSIPVGHAGKIEGRSSFARMGLSVHCSADFINPGYRGRMPLQLLNNGQSAIILMPGISICQLVFIKLSSLSRKLYGHPSLSSKYMNDDGGPSYWWRDKWIKKLKLSMQDQLGEKFQKEILNVVGVREPEVIERFEKMISEMKLGDLTNSSELLEKFSKTEEKERKKLNLKKKIITWIGPAFSTISIKSFLSPPYDIIDYWLWFGTAIALFISLLEYFFGQPIGEFFGEKELKEAKVEKK